MEDATYGEMVLNTDGRSSITKTGRTLVLIYHPHDIADIAPGGAFNESSDDDEASDRMLIAHNSSIRPAINWEVDKR